MEAIAEHDSRPKWFIGMVCTKESTGIGLYLCKTIMDKLGHGIAIKSEVEKGTKVYLAFRRKSLHTED